MCTVTYIPKDEEGFIFTSNRDEAPKRSATEIATEIIGNKMVKFPRDAYAKGTWIAISNTNQLVCILNGAFVKHKRNLPYRMSRGKMSLDFFAYKDVDEYIGQFEFEGMEPFTFIIFDNGELYELRWDEKKLSKKNLDTNKSYLWASCTLYDESWQHKRQKWFDDWKATKPEIIQDNIIAFHKNAGDGNPEFDLIMNRQNIVRTTSITSIINTGVSMKLRYEDILDNEVQSIDMRLI